MTKKRARDAETGRFTTMWYALKHKATTVIETIKPKRAS